MSDNNPDGQQPPTQQPPGYAPPGYPPLIQAAPPVRQRPGGLATAAFIVGIAACMIGAVPVIGAIVGIGGIILSIIALQKPRGRAFSVTGLILSSIAAIANLILTVVLIVTFVGNLAGRGVDGGATTSPPSDTSTLDLQAVDTPCYTFDGPDTYILNTSEADLDACFSQLELWGEVDADGNIMNTGFGAILGSVNVEPVTVATSDEMAPDGTLDSMVDALSEEFIPAMGELISLRESVTLDGMEANLTRVTSDEELTQTKVLLTVFAPDTYDNAINDVHFIVISFVIPEDNGDEIIDALVGSWSWK